MKGKLRYNYSLFSNSGKKFKFTFCSCDCFFLWCYFYVFVTFLDMLVWGLNKLQDFLFLLMFLWCCVTVSSLTVQSTVSFLLFTSKLRYYCGVQSLESVVADISQKMLALKNYFRQGLQSITNPSDLWEPYSNTPFDKSKKLLDAGRERSVSSSKNGFLRCSNLFLAKVRQLQKYSIVSCSLS